MRILNIMNISFGKILFLSFIALIAIFNLIRAFYFYKKLFGLLNKRPEEKSKLLSFKKNKYEFIFSKDWFENNEFEYYRIQTRESLKFGIIFVIGFTAAFLLFAFYGPK